MTDNRAADNTMTDNINGFAPLPEYTKFEQDMKYTHKILAPQMAPFHFGLISEILRVDGYDLEILENDGPNVVAEGLQYVHNDACYPAVLVIGQFIDAIKSGNYDTNRVALMITQTGGGCRASNYIFMLRKALYKAGYSHIPVISLNFTGLEGDSSFKWTLPMLKKAIAACYYGDALMCLHNQVRPYEDNKGEAKELAARWTEKITEAFNAGRGTSCRDMKRILAEIVRDFAAVKITQTDKIKVGIVGEIYVKYSPLGNNGLEEFLFEEGCEVNMPGLSGFVQYCVNNMEEDINLYGGNRLIKRIMRIALNFTLRREKLVIDAIEQNSSLRPPAPFLKTRELAQEFIGIGAKMGEGWLLTGELAELIESGFPNIVCAQPFGCMPNHIVGKAMISKLRKKYPNANIVAIDYDPGATKVNQINRIKLMLAEAKE